jgi:xanthine dehydrogenase iron-sulfur cluster and FAD-binding subunit A
MRASASYRRLVLRQLLQRAWLQQQGHPMTQLEDLA